MNRRLFFKSTGIVLGTATLSRFVSASTVQSNDSLLLAETSTPSGAIDPISSTIRLNFNENALGMSPKAKQAILNILPETFRYPDEISKSLITRLAQMHKLETNRLVLGNGSSEILHALVTAFSHISKPQEPVQLITPVPTFDPVIELAKSINLPVEEVALTEDHNFDLVAIQKQARKFKGISLIYICNPNNPTSVITPTDSLTLLIDNLPKDRTFFIIDEAYAEYVTDHRYSSALSLVQENYKNVVVVKTFSKMFALAGLRIGYAMAHPEFIKKFASFVSGDNINAPAAVAAIASLEDTLYIQRSILSNTRSRNMIMETLHQLDIPFLPSQTSFVFHQIKGDLQTYRTRMKESGILVGREFPPLSNWSRVSASTPEETKIFIEALLEFRKKEWI